MNKLFHYTQEEARNGICNNNTLWFKLTSKSRNDIKDTIYIREILKKAMIKYEGVNYFYEQAYKIMNSVLNPLPPENDNCFIEKNIFMFCAMKYKNDEDGKSFFNNNKDVYRIEFNKNDLVKFFKDLNQQIEKIGLFLFGEVIYDENLQIKAINDIITKYEEEYKSICVEEGPPAIFIDTIVSSTPCNDFSGISGNQPSLNCFIEWYPKPWEEMSEDEKMQLDKLWISLANEFYKLSTFIKDPSFEEKEHEFRIAFLGKPGFEKDRPINSSHCVEFTIDKSMIISEANIGHN